jgi:hypothetical protein
MALLKQKDVVPLRRDAVPEIEVEIADIARTVRGLGVSSNMERAKQLLTAGLTDAYDDGAKALEAALSAADSQLEKHEKAVTEERKQLDGIKRAAAEMLMAHKSRNSELAAGVQAHVAHLATMARWVEEQKATIAAPPALPRPAPLALEQLNEEEASGSTHQSE